MLRYGKLNTATILDFGRTVGGVEYFIRRRIPCDVFRVIRVYVF